MDHKIWVKGFILPLFNQGKDLEVRIGSKLTKWVKSGDTIYLNETLRREVLAIRRYNGAERMLASEGPNRIYPGKTTDDIRRLLLDVYGERVLTSEVVVWELIIPTN